MAEMLDAAVKEVRESLGTVPNLFCGPDASAAPARDAQCAALPANSLLKLDDYFDVAETHASPVPRAISSKESYLAGRRFAPRATDVIVATFPKSGTTFVTNVCHQLRSKCGANDFDEITAVVPWIDLALDVGQDLDADHEFEPRVFKSHMNPSNLNHGGRRILVVRDPVRVILSFFAFFKAKGVPFMRGVDDALAFVEHDFWQRGPLASSSRRGNVWQYVVETWFARGRVDTLVVPYEDAVAKPDKWIRDVALFMDVPCGDALAADVTAHSDKAYMIAHERQFDDHWIPEQQAKRGGAIHMLRASKVSKATHDKPDGLDAAMQAQWAKYVTPHTGHATYAEMLADLSA